MAATPPFLSPVSHQLLFSQISAMVLLISPERIQPESCACAKKKNLLKRGIGGYTQMMLGIRHEKEETRQT